MVYSHINISITNQRKLDVGLGIRDWGITNQLSDRFCLSPPTRDGACHSHRRSVRGTDPPGMGDVEAGAAASGCSWGAASSSGGTAGGEGVGWNGMGADGRGSVTARVEWRQLGMGKSDMFRVTERFYIWLRALAGQGCYRAVFVLAQRAGGAAQARHAYAGRASTGTIELVPDRAWVGP